MLQDYLVNTFFTFMRIILDRSVAPMCDCIYSGVEFLPALDVDYGCD